MDCLVSKIQLGNSMILLLDTEQQLQLQQHPESSTSSQVLPCKKVLASTPWKRQRDEILFKYLNVHNRSEPVLILVNSVVEVNLFTVFLKAQYPHLPDSAFKAIGTNLSAVQLLQELKITDNIEDAPEFKFIILSSQMALAAFIHGIIQITQFSLVCFADARGANQNHPFCIIMNHFYTPARFLKSFNLPRIIGFTDLKSQIDIEKDMFSRRDWIRTLKHFTHIFHCVPLTLDPNDLNGYLEQFPDFPLFDPLSIYETASNYIHGPRVATFDIPDSLNSDFLFLDHKTECNEIPQLINFIKGLRAKYPNLKRLIHTPQPTAQFSSKLSLFACIQNLKQASITPAVDSEMVSNLCNSATNLFSQSDHLLTLSQGIDRILRNPKTGSLLIESTAIPILVRCCTLLSRQFRQSAANETISFKTIRVFPVDSLGKRKSTASSHLSLLRLPIFFYGRIKDSLTNLPSVESDKFHLQGPLVTSRQQAQSCAAFEAVKLLISAGILDENLLLSSEYRKTEDEDDVSDDADNEIQADQMEIFESSSSSPFTDNETNLSFNEVIPDQLLLSENTKLLYIYAIENELKMQGTADDPFGLDSEAVLLTPLSRLLLSAIPTVNFFSSSKSSRTWSILLPNLLPETFVPIEIPIGANHFLKTRLTSIGSISLDSSEYQKLLNSQQTLFGMFNIKPLTVPDANTLLVVNDDDYSFENVVPKNKQPFYLIAPLLAEQDDDFELTRIESIPQVWKLFESFVKSFKSAPLDGTLYRPSTGESVLHMKKWSIDWNLCEFNGPNCSLLEYIEALESFNCPDQSLSVQLEEGGAQIDFKRFALERLAFHTPHTKIFYRSNRPSSNQEPVYPTSPFTSPSYPQVTTHHQYVQARYNLVVTNLEREMVATKRIENWSDLAVWISDDGATKKRRKKTQGSNNVNNNNTTSSSSGSSAGSSSTTFIIPELAQIFPCSYSTFRLAMLIPRVTFEIERQLRISQFFQDKLPPILPHPLHLRQVEAMTSSTASLSYSYEQLEVLGDSFLKYYSTLDTLLVGAGWSEGRLSSHRQGILCNANLRRAAEKLNITSYASFTPFFAKLWSPPPLYSHVSSTDPLSQTLNRVLFSPEERWKALRVVEGKQAEKQVIFLLSPDGALLIDENYKTKEQAKNSTDAIYKYGQLIPPKSLADIMEALIGIYYIDCGVQGALQFLQFTEILRPEILTFRSLDPLQLLCGKGFKLLQQEDQIDKLKRRKVTAMTEIILNNVHTRGDDSSIVEESLKSTIQQAQSINASVNQKVDNVQPYAPAFPDFPFKTLSNLLNYSFKHPELLFMACTHTSVDSKLNGEKLEWIGDAAIDWIVCRHYWYNYRITESADNNVDNNAVSTSSSADTQDTKTTETTENLLQHSSTPHIPLGHLPLSPESLTNSRQSAINNETFARLIIKFKFHQFLRINSPHLQIEIERFAEELKRSESAICDRASGSSGSAIDSDLTDSHDLASSSDNTIGTSDRANSHIIDSTPLSLDGLHTHVSVAAPKVLGDLFESLMGAILLDSNFDIDLFSSLFNQFLKVICFDPSSLPINAIQTTLHLYARLGIPRHQIVCTYKEIGVGDCLGTICQVWVRERCVAEAEGSNKLVAKKIAMERALQHLTTNTNKFID